ncbi:TIGR00341 family protein [Pontibacillus sp. HMF3514]|uniref:TIGR00341 family protein n=1 Tax=Pontibacillus sp. HMF3514 TaxID=2692425 RepID=UPI00131F8769|nr:TIGR00341 family protein [Pontibacillus sp. HMF3514]QHE51208.1 TIGR00341 family protein [Pontibacillus sp. HMF3514]
MSLQLIESYIPNKHFESVDEKLRDHPHTSYWVSSESKERMLVRILVDSDEVEDILNYLESVANVAEGFETLLIPVRTYLSRATLNEEAEEKKEEEEKGEEGDDQALLMRASRHELITYVEKNSLTTLNYTLLIFLSAVVGAMGFIKDSEAVVIGSMVIAPLIGPVIATAFAAILGDYRLLGKAALTSLLGVGIVVVIAIVVNFIFDIGVDTDQYWARTEVTASDFLLALAAGGAGSIATLNRKAGNLVGVMVAVALLPPNIALGMSIGKGLWGQAYGSFLLVTVNIMCILLSAVIVFSLTGIRPVRWREVQRANVSRSLSIVFVLLIVASLISVIYFGQDIKFE